MDPDERNKQKRFADYTTALKHKQHLEKELAMLEKHSEQVDDIITHKHYPEDMPVKGARRYFKEKKQTIDRECARIEYDLALTRAKLQAMEAVG